MRALMRMMVVMAGGAALPGVAAAQGQAYGTITLTTAQAHDANLFSVNSAAGPVADEVLRVTPIVEGGYNWPRLKVGGRYRFDADRYHQFSDLNRLFAREEAAADARFVATPRLRIAGDASYVTTDTPGELNLETRLIARRRPASRLAAASSAIFQATPRLSLTAAQLFTADRLVGSFSHDTHISSLAVAYRLTPRDTIGVNYELRRVQFSGPTTVDEARLFQVPHLTWTHIIASKTTLDVQAGPHIARDAIRPELSLSLRREGRAGEVSVGYAREQTTSLGELGLIDVHRVAARVAFRPWSRVTFGAVPAFAYNRRRDVAEDDAVPVYTLDAQMAVEAAPRVAIVGVGRFGRQDGRFSAPLESIRDRRVSVEVVVTLLKRAGFTGQWPGSAGDAE
jgi:hypothetical protein